MSDSAEEQSVPEVPHMAHGADKIARWLSVISILAVLLIGFKGEISNFFSKPSVELEFQDQPWTYTYMGYLRVAGNLHVRSSGGREVVVRDVLLSIKHSDGSDLKLVARTFARPTTSIVSSLVPFGNIALKPAQIFSEQVTFEENIADHELNSYMALDYRIARSLHDSATNSASSMAKPTIDPILADKELIDEVTAAYRKNFKLRPGSYRFTFTAIGQSQEILGQRVYEVSLLESVLSAFEENWKLIAGKKYLREMPPTRQVSFRLRPVT